MTRRLDPDLLGHASLSPDGPVIAGSIGTWTLTYTVGEYGFDDGGMLRVAWRFATDWEPPQFDRPGELGYTTVQTDGPGRVRARYDTQGNVRPWQKCVIVNVFDDGLRPGDTITITYGDTSEGSAGTRAQTFCEHTFEFRVLVDPFGTGEFERLHSSPEVAIVSGPAQRLVCIAPSYAIAGDPMAVHVKAEDEWGNPARGFEGDVELKGLWEQRQRATCQAGIHTFHVGGLPAGMHFFGADLVGARARHPKESDTLSNLVRVLEEPPPYRLLWADLHGQSEGTVGTNTVADYYQFARDYGLVDCCSHQGNCFQVTDEQWREIREETRGFYEPGRFVTLLGYEWSAMTAAGGDHNVLFRSDDESIFRCGQWLIGPHRRDDTDRLPVTELFAELRGHNALAIAHVGGRRANLDFHDEQVQRLVEIHSAWGTFEWLFEDALERGYRVGVCANSDGHKGRPGASYPGPGQFGTLGGLTGIYAEELTREAIWDALHARRCYATSGQRIILDVRVDGHLMGEEYATDSPPHIEVSVHGTFGVERVEVWRGLERIHKWLPPRHVPLCPEAPESVRFAFSGERVKGRNRAVCWDGRVTLSEGRILSGHGWALDAPTEWVRLVSPTEVQWQASTSGDADGVVLELDAPADAVLRFETEPATFEIEYGDIGPEPYVVEAGGVRQRVEVQRVSPLSRGHVAFHFRDEAAPPGEHAYWVKVLQTDGYCAWSSPVFVTLKRHER